ncbi:MAG: hypothetical protein C0501_08430 [Isosphaera sp.]|nr:hypothetical protein [Isosphaera sp.]
MENTSDALTRLLLDPFLTADEAEREAAAARRANRDRQGAGGADTRSLTVAVRPVGRPAPAPRPVTG